MPSHTIRSRPPAGPIRLDPSTVTQDPEVVSGYLEDAAHYPGGYADAVARPRSEDEVVAVVAGSTRVLPIGAQSSLTGGATPLGGTVLATDRLNKILVVGSSEVTVQAGVALRDLQDELRRRGSFYPPVPTFDGAVAGGVVATNAAGPATFKYGSTRQWVRGLTVVLPDGSVLDLRRGEVQAHPGGYFIVDDANGRRRVPIPTYRTPDLPKCSAGYFARPEMDLVDLFIGSEGTLGVVTSVTFAVVPVQPAPCTVWVPIPAERDALHLVSELRQEALTTWRDHDVRGIDVAAIEHLDRRSLDIIRQDGVDRALTVNVPDQTAVGLLAQLELPADSIPTPDDAFDQIADATTTRTPDTPLVRTCRILARAGVLAHAEIALPHQRRRQTQLLALREAVPEGVNRRVGAARRISPTIHKTAADMIVPFDRFEEMMAAFRLAFERRRLDYAIWGHISDGNVHPNVIPTTQDHVDLGHAAILECGQAVIRMGGCPLAEHGVGRSPTKQALLRELFGDRGVSEMRQIKTALDPGWHLAPGVLFPEAVRE